MIKVSNEIKTYGANGNLDKAVVQLNSHWSDNTMVIIVVDGKPHSVRAADLTAAIDNATNTARFS